jgi:methylglyoxal synthase
MPEIKRIGLVAHDNRKASLLEWAKYNKETLKKHVLIATQTTGQLLSITEQFNVECMESGPLGGDIQIGAKIVNGEIDILIFFWDPLESMAHDVDIRALLRIAVLHNIPVACNRSTADFLISSVLMEEIYERIV